MDKELMRKIAHYLIYFGESVKINDYDLSERDENGKRKGINFASIELITKEDLAKDLERQLNLCLSLEAGYQAQFRLIDIAELENNKKKYHFEIVPHSFIQRERWARATEDVLRALPKIIRNIRKQPH